MFCHLVRNNTKYIKREIFVCNVCIMHEEVHSSEQDAPHKIPLGAGVRKPGNLLGKTWKRGDFLFAFPGPGDHKSIIITEKVLAFSVFFFQ